MKLQVINKDIFRVDIPYEQKELVSDNTYTIDFELDSEWAGKTVTARASKGYDEPYIDEVIDSNGKASFNLTTGVWYISVWAAGLTSKPYKQYFTVSGKSFNGEPVEPEAPYYEQILSRMDELEQGAVSPEAIVEAVNNYLTEHPVEGVDETTVNALIAQYLEDNPIESLDASAVNTLIAQYLTNNPVDAYTKAQTDSMLAGKASASDVYTKGETDALIPEVPVKSISLNGTPVSPDAQGNVALSVSGGGGEGSGTSVDAYTKTETNTLLNAKADKSTTYTKSEVDSALSGKADASTTYTKTEVDTALVGKASANNVYTKHETDELIPEVPVKSISFNDTPVNPDAQGNVAINYAYTISSSEKEDIADMVQADMEAVELTGTLTAGQTSLTLSDEAISTNSIIDIYVDKWGVSPTNATTTTGSITMTFTAQASNMSVKVIVRNPDYDALAGVREEVYIGTVQPSASEGYKLWINPNDTPSSGGGSNLELLWTNSAASSASFSAQTISLDLSDYKAVEIVFLVKASYSSHVSQSCFMNLTDRIFVGSYDDEVKFFDRIVKPTSTGVQFYDGSNNGATDNTVCVPRYIYGIK